MPQSSGTQLEVIDEILAEHEQRMEEFFENLHARCLVVDIPRSIIGKAESLVVEVLAELAGVLDSEVVDSSGNSIPVLVGEEYIGLV